MPASVPDHALCVGCNYALRGLADFRCPECGRPFDPDRPPTMNLGRPLDVMPRWVLGPIGLWGHVCMVLAAAYGVLGPAWLAPSRRQALYSLLVWAGFFFACWLRHLVRRNVVIRYRQPLEMLRVDDRFDRRAKAVFAVVLMLVLTRAPFALALLASRPWLDRFAHQLWAERPASSPEPLGPMVRGLFLISWVDTRPSGVTFYFPSGSGIRYERDATGERLTPRYYPESESR